MVWAGERIRPDNKFRRLANQAKGSRCPVRRLTRPPSVIETQKLESEKNDFDL